MKSDKVNEQQEQILRSLVNMTDDQLSAVLRLSNLSETQIDGLDQIIKDQPTISAQIVRKQAYGIVLGGIKRAFTWVVTFAGLVWLGFDKIKDILKFLVDTIIAVIS